MSQRRHSPSNRRKRADYVARRDADPMRSVYSRLPADPAGEASRLSRGEAEPPVWPSARGHTTSMYQLPVPDVARWRRAPLVRLLLAAVIACPLLLLVWVVYEWWML